MFKKILIANRGEIAIRVIRSAQEMGIASVAIYAEDDREARHARLADESYALTGTQLAETYLNQARIIEIAKQAGAEAIHPGYGFLSENAAFSQACAEAGLVFIGPSAEVIRAMGSKLQAREVMGAAGVPLTPGSPHLDSLEKAQQWADKIGYPVLLKASAGGGGRGMKKVMTAADLPLAYQSACRESQNYFGDATIYLEKWVTNPRHVEVQILADQQGHVIHLGERDCSVQRRHQKLVEETPAPHLPEALRQEVHAAAVRGAAAIQYTGAGTFEFVVQNNQDVYFMEVNTRLQVEHPITEMVTGVDLVKEQIRIAAGLPLSYTQEHIQPRGHAIECRITAEDARQNFLPSPGYIQRYQEPSGFGVRVDSMAYANYELPRSYDSLIAKLVVWGANREEAVARMSRALREYQLEGATTLLPFFSWLMHQPDFAAGHYHTGFVAEHFKPEYMPPGTALPTPTLPGTEPQDVTVEVNHKRFQVKVFWPERQGAKPAAASLKLALPQAANKNAHADPRLLSAPMAGTVMNLLVKVGDVVTQGQPLVVVESMKMENDILAARAGTVKTIHIAVGQKVQNGDVLLELEPDTTP